MKVLVIGGTGPSGTPLVRELLDRGHQVTIYHSGTHEADWAKEVEHIHGDFREEEAPKRDLANKKWDGAINTRGRTRFIVPALRGKIEKLVAVTGHGAYKNIHCRQPSQLGLPVPIRETMPVRGPDDEPFYYRLVQGEKTIMQARKDGYFQTCIFRYPRVYGPNTNPHLNFDWYWVKRIIDGRRRILLPGDGMTVAQRGFGANLGHMLTLGLESDKSDGQVYNCCDSLGLSLKMITTTFAEALGHQWEMIPVPFVIAPRGNPYAFYSHTLLDTSKARYQLGYEDVMHPIEATRLTARWLREHPLSDEEHRDSELYQRGAFDYAREDEIIEKYLKFVSQFPPQEERSRSGW